MKCFAPEISIFFQKIALGLFFALPLMSVAQDSLPVQFRNEQQRLNDKEVLLSISVKVRKEVKLYGLQNVAVDQLHCEVVFDSASDKYLLGGVEDKSVLKRERDTALGFEVAYVTDSARWEQKVRLNSTDSVVLKGVISYFYKQGQEYFPGETKFKFFIRKANAADVASMVGAVDDTGGQSLWWIFLAAFGGGLLALLTPCVYSMIPVTVSFFTKRSTSRRAGIRNALYYSTSIVAIFTLFGFLVTLIFGPAALNHLATNWMANLVFFILFLVFGICFLGAFEITLPASWTNSTDAKAGTGNFLGIFFMALTLVIVSFSCTGPIIGNLLVLAAKGNYFGPLVGMLGFSLALALPFALFAFFPSKLNMLGKSGGWLNAVKVTLGFLELALALKFLSNADLSKGWRLLDREVFLCLWIVIFLLLGAYLLGKLHFHHDDALPKNDFGIPYVSIPRLLFAVTSLAFAAYMMPGLWGAPLKGISAFLPPMGTQDWSITNVSSLRGEEGALTPTLSTPREGGRQSSVLPAPVKYAEKMQLYEPEVVQRSGLVTYFDYPEALAIARQLHRPLMIDFTGINCVNCRKMEGQVWSDPEVMRRLKENFVVVSLYVDVQDIDLPEDEQYKSVALGKRVETLGDKNADRQISKFGASSQPNYFFVDAQERPLMEKGYGYDPDVAKFVGWLEEVGRRYQSR